MSHFASMRNVALRCLLAILLACPVVSRADSLAGIIKA